MGTKTTTGRPTACPNSSIVSVPRLALRALVEKAFPVFIRCRYLEGCTDAEDAMEWGNDRLNEIIVAREALLDRTLYLAWLRAGFATPDPCNDFPSIELLLEELAKLEDAGRG